jgi:hypothetical protein
MSPTQRKFDAMLTAALERQPEIAVPANFAARLSASLPAARPAQRAVRTTHYGRTIATACTLLLIAALFLVPILYPHSLGTHSPSLHNNAFVLEIFFTLVLAILFAVSEMLQFN